jgi:Mitochondrial carrier protein
MDRDVIASCCAGFVSRVICHPIDTFKARLQARQSTGFSGVYRGLAAALVGGVPATCIYLTSYEASKRHLSTVPYVGDSPFLVYFCSGIVAEAVSCSIFVPTDVVKERLQVGLYKSSTDAFKQIVTQEGFRGLYKGYGASMLSFGPFSALYFALYEGLKKHAFTAGQFSDNLYRYEAAA